jgi:mannose-6-phosphate isomerase-like protein (cupin superfamily)
MPLSGLCSRRIPDLADELAPDGSEVRRLCRTDGASMAHFTFPAGAVSQAIAHRQVAELWYILSGEGEIWRMRTPGKEEVLDLVPGMSLDIPAGCAFQVRAGEETRLEVVAVTLPPWPGDSEATPVTGPWKPSISAGSDPAESGR